MTSPLVERVIAAAQGNGIAFLKRVSPNDLGITGAHQKGYYLPKQVAQLFTPDPPVRGVNSEHAISIDWADGTRTASMVKWYGAAKDEYRITRFNRIHNFYYLRPERLGSVLVLIQVDQDCWRGELLEYDDDVDDVLAALGLTLDDSSWALYTSEGLVARSSETTSECERRRIASFAEAVTDFPATREMAATALDIVASCLGVAEQSPDRALLALMRIEYDLFRAVERGLLKPILAEGFRTVEDFLALAQSVLQRRKARAGRSLELHLEELFTRSGLSFESQPRLDGTRPDFVFPSADAYNLIQPGLEDPSVLVVSVKTTCKDRWRQVVAEGPRVSTKYLITLQPGISSSQMREIREAGVQLVVPAQHHSAFAPADLEGLLSVEDFIAIAHGLRA